MEGSNPTGGDTGADCGAGSVESIGNGADTTGGTAGRISSAVGPCAVGGSDSVTSCGAAAGTVPTAACGAEARVVLELRKVHS